VCVCRLTVCIVVVIVASIIIACNDAAALLILLLLLLPSSSSSSSSTSSSSYSSSSSSSSSSTSSSSSSSSSSCNLPRTPEDSRVRHAQKFDDAPATRETFSIISSATRDPRSLSTRPFIFVPLDSAEATHLPLDMSFSGGMAGRKADRVIGQLTMKILGSEIKDDTSTRKVSPRSQRNHG